MNLKWFLYYKNISQSTVAFWVKTLHKDAPQCRQSGSSVGRTNYSLGNTWTTSAQQGVWPTQPSWCPSPHLSALGIPQDPSLPETRVVDTPRLYDLPSAAMTASHWADKKTPAQICEKLGKLQNLELFKSLPFQRTQMIWKGTRF